MSQPVGEQERFFFIEIAVVENQQKLRPISVERLDRMRNAGREVQRSPSPTSSWNVWPSWSMAVIRTRPLRT